MAALIYPIQASWVWGAGWLSEMGFSDFAGSTLVHSTGGWAALAGAIVLGARKGKYNEDGSVNPMPGSNLPLATARLSCLFTCAMAQPKGERCFNGFFCVFF